MTIGRRAQVAFIIAVLMYIPQICFAGLVMGSGDEVTWIYNPTDGNLKLELEMAQSYSSVVLDTGLAHFDVVKGDLDYATRFLESASIGWSGSFGGILSSSKVSYINFGSPLIAGVSTIDLGDIMVTGLTSTDIFTNWSTEGSISPSGGFNSAVDMTAVGVIVVPEPSPFLTLSALSGVIFSSLFIRRVWRGKRV